MSGRDARLSGRVLAAMRDGVMALDTHGRILTFNPAAGAMLGRDPAKVVGALFAEVFLEDEHLDEFNELVFASIYDSQTVHNAEIELVLGSEVLILMVASSFLWSGEPGESERLGVVVVFTDITEARQRARLKQIFGAYVDTRIVDQVLASPDAGKPRRGRMTISFVDLRGFTGWSERLQPEELVLVLNAYLAAMTVPIGEAGGITDKYIGDAVMACWGAPFTPPETEAEDACRAALGQQAALPALRRRMAEAGILGAETLDAVAGIAMGDVLTGEIGPVENRSFTLIGSPVNVAARLQDLAKRYGRPVVVSDAVRQACGPDLVFQTLDTVRVRGSKTPLPIFALIGTRDAVSSAVMAQSEQYEAALVDYRARRFLDAAAKFAGCASVAGKTDAAAVMMAGRALAYAADTPGEDWDGTWDR